MIRARSDGRATKGIAARRIERVMQQRDLPFRTRLRRFMLEPLHLRSIEIRAVQGEKPHARVPPRDRIHRRREGVIAIAIHVERLVEHLLRIVVIAEHRVELDAGVEQQLVRLLELQPVVLRRGGPLVDIVARHQHELEVEALAIRDHLRGHFVLGRPAAAAVADHGELDRPVLVREGSVSRGTVETSMASSRDCSRASEVWPIQLLPQAEANRTQHSSRTRLVMMVPRAGCTPARLGSPWPRLGRRAPRGASQLV